MAFLSNIGQATVEAGKTVVGGILSDASQKLPPLFRGPVAGVISDVFGGAGAGKKPIKVSNLSSDTMQDWSATLVWELENWVPLGTDQPIFNFLPKRNGAPTIVFPFTPQVSVNYTASYEQIHTSHTNLATPAYDKSNVADISVMGEFVANTANDANYVYAVIHFLKSATKSFNASDPETLAGRPPPILYFNYLGLGGFQNTPVVLTGMQLNYPKEVDYVSTVFGNSVPNSMVPAETTIAITMMPAFDRAAMVGKNNDGRMYTTSDFIKGNMISKGHF